jgi:YCII-related domain
MQYMLVIYGDERAAESTPREQTTEIINAYMAYTKALQDAKVVAASNRLKPTSAATVLITDGQTKVLDGPFAETKEPARRLLPDRCARSRRRTYLGEALPRYVLRQRRGAADLGDVSDTAPAHRAAEGAGLETG